MDAGLDTLLKVLKTALNVSSQNPIAVTVSVVIIFGAYGFIRYQMKKAEERQIERDRQAARADNIDVLEGETSESNDEIRGRMRDR